MKAWYGTREASKCWGNAVTDTLISKGCKPVVVAPMMFVSENHGYVSMCHGDDFVSCGSAGALDEGRSCADDTLRYKDLATKRTDSVWWGTEGKHLGRTIRWTPQGFEWESNCTHDEDMVELCGLKLYSNGALTPITKATGKGRRDIDDALDTTDVQTFRQATGTGPVHVDQSSITPVCDVRGDEWNE